MSTSLPPWICARDYTVVLQCIRNAYMCSRRGIDMSASTSLLMVCHQSNPVCRSDTILEANGTRCRLLRA